MNNETLIFNIQKYCEARNTKPTPAAIAAGIGRTFFADLKRGKTPSVAKVAALAEHLNVSVSDLVGDAKTPAELAPLSEAWAALNDEGRARLVEYAEDLVAGGRFSKKSNLSKEA